MEAVFQQIATGEIIPPSLSVYLLPIATVVGLVVTYFAVMRDAFGLVKGVRNFFFGTPRNEQTLTRADKDFQPRLTLRETADEGAARRFFFGSAARVPFQAREREVATLSAWLDDKAPFSWTMLRGPGGQGKSRLAAELCRARLPTWNAGFLIDGVDDDPARYVDFYPKRPHLIVIDYVAARADKVGRLIRNLSAHPTFAKRVRVLLIEREGRTSHWWRDFVATAELETMERCAHVENTEPGITVEELGQANLLAIARHVSGRADLDQEKTLAQLRKVDPKGRPLFAELLGDALRTDAKATFSSQGALLDAHLAREWQRWSRIANRDTGILYRHLNAVAMATIAGGVSLPVALSAEVEPAFPFQAGKFNADLIREMTGRAEKGKIAAMEPDIVGEWFVLQHLRFSDFDRRQEWPAGGGPTDHIREGFKCITVADTNAFARAQAFRIRLALDFPSEPYRTGLFPVPTLASAWHALQWARGTLALLDLYPPGASVDVFMEFAEILEKSPAGQAPEARQVIIQSLLFARYRRATPHDVASLLDEIASTEIFTTEFPNDPLIAVGRIDRVMSAMATMTDEGRLQTDGVDANAWHEAFLAVKKIATPFVGVFEVRNKYADCLAFLAAVIPDEGEVFKELRSLRNQAPNDKVLAIGIADLALNLFQVTIASWKERLFDVDEEDELRFLDLIDFVKWAVIDGPWRDAFGPVFVCLASQAGILRPLAHFEWDLNAEDHKRAYETLERTLTLAEKHGYTLPNKTTLLDAARRKDEAARRDATRRAADAITSWSVSEDAQKAIADAKRTTRAPYLKKAHASGLRVFDSYRDLIAKEKSVRAAA